MSSNSINTNVGAIVALQNLNVTSMALQTTQNQISTGLAISGAKDNGAIWNIAQNSRAAISSLDAVKQSLQRAQSTVDVAVSAGQTISDLLNQIKANASTIYALANATGSSKMTILPANLGVGNSGGAIAFTAAASFTTATTAATFLSLVNTSITAVNSAVAKLGTISNAITTHLTFISNLQDSLTQGVGNLVDADVAKESAQLTALQTKQQLGVQALSIANASKQGLLSLFR
jgi:flagellin